jgi:hypothetical protein
MANQLNAVLSAEELATFLNCPEVQEASQQLQSKGENGVVYFTAPLSKSTASTLTGTLGVDLSTVSNVPMRWITGDTVPHIDVGQTAFSNTVLLYMNNSPGELIVDGVGYPITENTAYRFNEGLSHETCGTQGVPRLLMGPMNELGSAVGIINLNYFAYESDALSFTNSIGNAAGYTLGTIGDFSNWTIASNSTGSDTGTFTAGDTLTGDGSEVYYLYAISGERPLLVYYYLYESDALATNVNSIGSSYEYTVLTVDGYTRWNIASSSTGPTTGSIDSGDTLTGFGSEMYYLYINPGSPPDVIFYYLYESEALINTNTIGSSPNYTLESPGGYSTWIVASNSTGSSTGTFSTGDTLDSTGDPIYYVYVNSGEPPTVVEYYINEANALSNIDRIGYSPYYIVETIGMISFWTIASNSTGLTTGSVIAGNSLDPAGNYYLYQTLNEVAKILYFNNESDALAISNVVFADPTTYTLQKIGTLAMWAIASNSTGPSPQNVIYSYNTSLDDTGSGVYYVYAVPITYFANVSDATTYQNWIGYSLDYNVSTIGEYNNWTIQITSSGSSSGIATSGDILNSDGSYFLTPAPPTLFSVYYYPTLSDALNFTNTIATSSNYTVELQGGFNSWRIASSSSGSSSQTLVYTVGQSLTNDGVYYLYPSAPCFLEGTRILSLKDEKEQYIPIETLRPGNLVKTSRNGFKKIAKIGYGMIQNPGTLERSENRLYKCSKEAYAELNDDLYLTGCHSILVDSITDKQRQETIQKLGRIFVTDKKYRLMACIDERAEPWASEGSYTIWHFALEDTDTGINFGVYANGGLLVETCSLRFLEKKSNMTFV